MFNWDPPDDLVLPFILKVAMGNIPGVTYERKFGAIDSIQAATPADCWAYGVTPGAERYTWSDDGVADIDRVSSSSALDTIDVRITGLDIDGYLVSQNITLTGQTPVALTTPLWRVNRVENNNGSPLAGNVYVFVNGATSGGVPTDVTRVRGYIKLGDEQTLQTIYTVPKGKTAFLMGSEVSISKTGVQAGTINFAGFIRLFGKVFKVKDQYDLVSTGTSRTLFNSPMWGPFPELSDFRPRVTASTSGMGASWSFTILLINS